MKILIVDDVKGWRDYHKLQMEEMFEGCEIQTAESAREGYDKLMENNDKPFDIIITDMQMESDFEPDYAGEWLVKQIKTFKNYLNTKVVIISATYNIHSVAESLGVECVPKSTALKFPEAYDLFRQIKP